jgi:hypothetical protein
MHVLLNIFKAAYLKVYKAKASIRISFTLIWKLTCVIKHIQSSIFESICTRQELQFASVSHSWKFTFFQSWHLVLRHSPCLFTLISQMGQAPPREISTDVIVSVLTSSHQLNTWTEGFDVTKYLSLVCTYVLCFGWFLGVHYNYGFW